MRGVALGVLLFFASLGYAFAQPCVPTPVGVPCTQNWRIENTLSGNPTISGTPTFSGAPSFTAGGSLSGTFTGNPTFSGAPAFSGASTFSGTPSFAHSLSLTDGTNTASTHLTFPTFAALKAFDPTNFGPLVASATTAGRISAGDYGGASYDWCATCSGTNDDILTIQPTPVTGAGRWLYHWDGRVFRFEQAGVIGDYAVTGSIGVNLPWTGTDNYTALTAMLAALAGTGKGVIAQGSPTKSYYFATGDITTPANVSLSCPAVQTHIIRNAVATPGLYVPCIVHDDAHHLYVGSQSNVRDLTIFDTGMSPNGPSSWRDMKLRMDQFDSYTGGMINTVVGNSDGSGCTAGDTGYIAGGTPSGRFATVKIASTGPNVYTIVDNGSYVSFPPTTAAAFVPITGSCSGTTVDITHGAAFIETGYAGKVLSVVTNNDGSGCTVGDTFYVGGSPSVVKGKQAIVELIQTGPNVYHIIEPGAYVVFPPLTNEPLTVARNQSGTCAGATVDLTTTSPVSSAFAITSGTGQTVENVHTAGFDYGAIYASQSFVRMSRLFTSMSHNGVYVGGVAGASFFDHWQLGTYYTSSLTAGETGLVSVGPPTNTGSACVIGTKLLADPAAGTFTTQAAVVVTSCSGTAITGVSARNADGGETGEYSVTPRANNDPTPLAFSDGANESITAVVYFPQTSNKFALGEGAEWAEGCDACSISDIYSNGFALAYHLRDIGLGTTCKNMNAEPIFPPPNSGVEPIWGATATAFQTDQVVNIYCSGGHMNGTYGVVRLMHQDKASTLVPGAQAGGLSAFTWRGLQFGQPGSLVDGDIFEFGPGSQGVISDASGTGTGGSLAIAVMDKGIKGWQIHGWQMNANNSSPFSWISFIDTADVPKTDISVYVQKNNATAPVWDRRIGGFINLNGATGVTNAGDMNITGAYKVNGVTVAGGASNHLYQNTTLTNCVCGSTSAFETLMSYALPANTMSSAGGDALQIVASGNFAATTDDKTLEITLAATVLAHVETTSASALKWRLQTQWMNNAVAPGPVYSQAFNGTGVSSVSTDATVDGGTTAGDITGNRTIALLAKNATAATAASISAQSMTVDYIH